MKKKVSFSTLLLSCIFVSIITFALPKFILKDTPPVKQIAAAGCNPEMEQIRLDDYKYVKPLVLANVNLENQAFNGLRSSIQNYIIQAKSKGLADDITVYFRRLNDGTWFSINPELTYNPASLSKIIFLITYLKEAEIKPGLLDKKIRFEKKISELPTQNIKDFELAPNKDYSIRDLLTYMIKYSDNDATTLIIQNINKKVYEKVFHDFKIPLPPEFGEYTITAGDYSKFFRALFNATYIRPDLSEYALKVLTQCTFKDGIIKGIDPSIEVAHKFGERIIDNTVQLHEFGIVFTAGEPYLLGVMTKGKSLKSQSEVLSEISQLAFSGFRFYENS